MVVTHSLLAGSRFFDGLLAAAAILDGVNLCCLAIVSFRTPIIDRTCRG
jgi:hypothetical protein